MKKIKTLLTILLAFTSLIVSAQLSKSEADDLMLNIINNDTTIVVYGMNEFVGNGFSVMTAEGNEIRNPYDNSYVYFIDDVPAANWVHPCRYCFINKENGLYKIENENIYPNDFESFSRLGKNYGGNRGYWPYTTYTIPNKAAPNSKLYAVLIAGDVGYNASGVKAWYNLSCVYTTLVNKYGFIEDDSNSHIIVSTNYDVKYAMQEYNSTWTSSPYSPADLNHSCGALNSLDFYQEYTQKQDISLIFQSLAGGAGALDDIPELEEDDQLFVMICGVGSKYNDHSRIMLTRGQGAEYLYDDELAQWVRNIKCSQMTFLIACNYAGGFIDDVMNDPLAVCKNRAVHTSTDADNISYTEQHITNNNYRGGNGGGLVDEYIYYWSAASLGYYPILEMYTDSISGPWYKYQYTAIGQFPWSLITSFGNSHVGYDVSPDINNDMNVSMSEAFVFANNLDSYSPTGYYDPYTGDNTDVEYPQSSYESTFTQELITLNGYKGKIINNAATGLGHKYSLDGKVTVAQNVTLTINNNCMINGNNKALLNNGTLQTANDLSNATFKRVLFNNGGGVVDLEYCVFDTCGVIHTQDGPFSLESSTLNQTCINAEAGDEPRDNYNVIISNNVFNNTTSISTISLNKIPQCYISGNTITSGVDGINIARLTGVYSNYVFSGNTIHYCGGSGFVAYGSNGILNGNSLLNNDIDGIQSLNLSGLHIRGDSTVTDMEYTQKIKNNERYQVYASNNSYPQDFHYNWLVGNGTNSDYILFFESNNQQGFRPVVFNVTKNCWYSLSDTNIPAHLLLTGNAVYNYLPTWTLTGPSYMSYNPSNGLVQSDLLVANGDFEAAKLLYEEIVREFPESSEAIEALKALFAIEIATNGCLENLKSYYLGLLNDDNLGNIADNLANRCDVEIGNYDAAIRWYENKIIDTNTSYSERIFAEIDLGDLYLHMADIGNKGVRGKMTEYIPDSWESHAKHTKQLLSMLPCSDAIIVFPNVVEPLVFSSVEQMTCSPNPASDKIILSYTLGCESNVEIILFSMQGIEIKHVCLDKQKRGNYILEIDISNIKDGVYFCSIQTDGNKSKSTKIVINHKSH